jgi:hypothetical protein
MLPVSRPRTHREHRQWWSIKLVAETFKAHGCEVDFIPTAELGARTLPYHPSSSGPCMNA